MALVDSGDWAEQAVRSYEGTSENWGWGVALGDLDGDGRKDILLPDAGGNVLYRNLEEGWTAEGLPQPFFPQSSGAVIADVNGDGRLDAFFPGGGPDSLLLADGAGGWEDGTIAAGLWEMDDTNFSAAFADYDRDGDLDLLMPVFAPDDGAGAEDPSQMPPGDPTVLLESQGDGEFADASELLPADIAGYPFIAGWTDFDRDGWLDIYLTHDHGEWVSPNRMLRNEGVDGDGQHRGFSDVSEATGLLLAASSMGLGIGDINGDGSPDYFVTSTENSHLLLSADGPTWVDSAVALGLQPEGDRQVGWGAEIADLDNDGLLDGIALFGYWQPEPGSPEQQPDALYLQQPDGTFEEVSAAWGLDDRGWGRGLALADLNGDGWLDVVKRELHAPARLYLSRCGEAAWLEVALRQAGPNPFGVGAEVVVEVKDRTHRRWLTAGGTGLSSGGPMTVHVGLGEAETVERLTVRWPDGGESLFEGIATRQQLTVLRAGSE